MNEQVPAIEGLDEHEAEIESDADGEGPVVVLGTMSLMIMTMRHVLAEPRHS